MISLLMQAWQLMSARRDRPAVPHDRDRGDVPGWVLITLMTVGIVMALWLVAEPALSGLIKNALNISGDPNSGH